MVNRDGSFSKGRTFFPFIERRCIIGLDSVRFRPRVTRAKIGIGAWLIKKNWKNVGRREGEGGEKGRRRVSDDACVRNGNERKMQ